MVRKILTFGLEMIAVGVLVVLFLVLLQFYYPDNVMDTYTAPVVSHVDPYLHPVTQHPTVQQGVDLAKDGQQTVSPYIRDVHGASSRWLFKVSNPYDFNYDEVQTEVDKLNINAPDPDGDAKSVVILNYHGVFDDPYEVDQYSISLDTFKDHMYTLKSKGYETVSLEDLYAFSRGEKELPERSFVITFDDGVRETYYNVDPVLKALDYEAVMFAITDQSLKTDTSYYLNIYELEEMDTSGRWDIQSHSHAGHDRAKLDEKGTEMEPSLSNRIWLEDQERLETPEEYSKRVDDDLHKAKIMLEESLNKEITGFAIPFGDFGQYETNYPASREVLINTSRKYYDMAFFQFKPAPDRDYRGNYQGEPKDFYLMMRIPADNVPSGEKLMEHVRAAEGKELPYTETYENARNWITLWGDVKVNGDSIIITDESGINGGFAYLDGSYIWEDYTFTTRVTDPEAAARVALMGRFRHAQDYVSCRFDDNSAAIDKVGEKRVRIATGKYDGQSLEDGSEIGIQIQGDTIRCLLDGDVIAQTQVPSVSDAGGVAMRVERLNNIGSAVLFDTIRVTPGVDDSSQLALTSGPQLVPIHITASETMLYRGTKIPGNISAWKKVAGEATINLLKEEVKIQYEDEGTARSVTFVDFDHGIVNKPGNFSNTKYGIPLDYTARLGGDIMFEDGSTGTGQVILRSSEGLNLEKHGSGEEAHIILQTGDEVSHLLFNNVTVHEGMDYDKEYSP